MVLELKSIPLDVGILLELAINLASNLAFSNLIALATSRGVKSSSPNTKSSCAPP